MLDLSQEGGSSAVTDTECERGYVRKSKGVPCAYFTRRRPDCPREGRINVSKMGPERLLFIRGVEFGSRVRVIRH